MLGLNNDDLLNFLNCDEILNYIPSRTLVNYLKSDGWDKDFSKESSDKKNHWNSYPIWSYMQLATLADLYMPNRKKVGYLRELAKDSNNQNEKHLLRLIAKDKAKYRYSNNRYSAETINFFRKHFSKPFTAGLCEELLFFPVIFQAGDVVSYNKRGCLNFDISHKKGISMNLMCIIQR